MEKLVSVVVPVYNVRDYLEECLESILNQTYGNLEILLIDDGSTDGSSELCDAYAQKDRRIRVIHQENVGAAAARKRGIWEAAGEFLCFVDGDDTADAGMVRYFLEHIGTADILTSGCRCEKAGGAYLQRFDAFEEGVYKTEEEIEYIIRNMIMFQNSMEDGVLPYLINKLYRTGLLKKAAEKINERIRYAEDRELLFRYLLNCREIIITKKSFYNYRYRSTSAVNAPNTHFLRDLDYFYNSLKSEFELHDLKDSLLQQLEKFIFSRTLTATRFMGFLPETWCICHLFPFYNVLEGKRVILYGAGRVGIDYYRQLKTEKNCRVVLWTEKNWKKYQASYKEIGPVEQILQTAFDVIIIAVKKKALAESIMAELEKMGVRQEQMCWKAPVEITAI